MPETTSKDWDAFNIEKTALKKGGRESSRKIGRRMKAKKSKPGKIVLPEPKRTIH